MLTKQCFKLDFLEKYIYNNNNKSKHKLLDKQWSLKVLGIFDKTNCMKKYFLVNSVITTGLEPRTTQFLNEHSFGQMVECSFKN